MNNPYKLKLKELNLTYKTILGTASTKTVKGESIGFLTGIGLEKDRRAAGGLDGFHHRRTLRRAASRDDHLGAASGEIAGNLGTDAAGGTGDEGDFVLEGSFHIWINFNGFSCWRTFR